MKKHQLVLKKDKVIQQNPRQEKEFGSQGTLGSNLVPQKKRLEERAFLCVGLAVPTPFIHVLLPIMSQ